MTPIPDFVHLRAHTEYSVVDSSLRVGDYAKAAAKDGQGALAVTDLNNLFGALKFYKACRKNGIKPILAAEVRMMAWQDPASSSSTIPVSRMVLIAQSDRGYHNLSELLSRGWIQGESAEQATLKWEWLQELGEGLIVLSGADAGPVGMALMSGKPEQARACARDLDLRFPGRFFLEIHRADRPQDEPHLRLCLPLAIELNIPVVATHPIQFLQPQDHVVHEARICIAQGLTIADPKRERQFVKEQHFKTREEMFELFADLPVALANSVSIAQRCNLTLVLGKPQLPAFPTPIQADGARMPIEAYFRELSLVGLNERLIALYPEERIREEQRPRYTARLDFEINVILKMGFPGYFLIVADFIVWAKKNGCPVGPGRGSGAGSLVAYSLKITDLDPLEYGLLFERFLNPDRVSMPDFDIDFCRDNRDRVIEYVKDKYGREAVSQIATFGTMAAKAALRDVGRVMGMGYGQVDGISKLIPSPPGKYVTLAQVPAEPEDGVIYARKEAPELARREAADEEVAALLAMAANMEGTVRNIGMHAGGVLIAPGKITDFCPLYQQPGSDSAVSQFDKDDVEEIGLVKFDFLGLATLTILEIARGFIAKRHPTQRDFSYETIPLDDPAVYELFCNGHSEAVFQFESRGMQSLLREAKPNRLEDLIALNALYRPGPMDLIPTFVARKHGREKVEYPHHLVEKMLSETYGIMVYQEQVMQTAQLLGGYTLGAADLLRRAMGKKKADEMAKHREIFREGASKNGILQAQADEIFDLMEKFAGYGFNKSHAAAYSLLAYHTAYIKVHFRTEFFAANLTVEQGDTDKLKVLLLDAKRFDVAIEPPHINAGTSQFEPAGANNEHRIRYSLAAIKGTGRLAIDTIVAERTANGPFKSLFDFCARVDRRKLNKRILEALIKAGAFDSLHPNRAQAMASISMAMDWADSKSKNALQVGLFDAIDEGFSSDPAMACADPWGRTEQLEHERSAIGFILSGHLIEEHEAELRRFCSARIQDVHRAMERATVCGVVVGLKVFDGNFGSSAVVTIDDKSGQMDVVLSQEMMLANKDWLKTDALVIAVGRPMPDKFSGGFRLQASQVMDMAHARSRHARHLLVEVDGKNKQLVHNLMLELQTLAKASKPAQSSKGKESRWSDLANGSRLPLRFLVSGHAGQVDLVLADHMAVEPNDVALAKWRALSSRVEVVY